jgi:hypothetical protein
MEWFEVCGQRYCDQLEPEQFMYSMLTRSQRISHENLRLRDPAGWKAMSAGLPHAPACRCPMPDTAADVHALHLARADAEEPRRGLADGAVLLRRRRAGRLPPGAPGRARARRRRPGGGRDDLPLARCAHHARLPGPVERRAARRLGTHRRLRACESRRANRACSSAMPAPRARPMRPGTATAPTMPLAAGNWPLLAASPAALPGRAARRRAR